MARRREEHGEDAGPRLRADARRNHAAVLEAARDVFVERGASAPLEDVARRAGVGIGTVYRRFGDRDGLLRAVVLEALVSSYESAVAAREGSDTGLDAVARYMHDALDLRVSAVIPLALDRLDLDEPELAAARERSASAVEGLIDAAHEDGTLSARVTFADLGTLLVRLARPLPGGLQVEFDNALAHRHLELVLAGLRSAGLDALEQGESRGELRSRGPGT